MRASSVAVLGTSLALALTTAACTPVPDDRGDPAPSGSGVNRGSPVGSPGFGSPSDGATATATPTATPTRAASTARSSSTPPPTRTAGRTPSGHTRTPSPARHPDHLDIHLSTVKEGADHRTVSLTALASGYVDDPIGDDTHKPLDLPDPSDLNASRYVRIY